MDKPNPGSREAELLGCTCPVLDNRYGDGIQTRQGAQFVMSEDCPIHGLSVEEETDRFKKMIKEQGPKYE